MSTLRLALLASFFAFAALASAAQTASPNPLHFSLTEATCNRERGRLLLTVRLQTSDLETVLSERAQHKISVAEPAEFAPAALEYVREKLRLITPKGDLIRLEWAGQDVAEKQVFLFFEASLTGSPQGLRIANTLLLEQLPDQLNSLELRDGATKQTLVFSREKPEQIISAKP